MFDRREFMLTASAQMGLAFVSPGRADALGLSNLAARRGLFFGAAVRNAQLKYEQDFRQAVLRNCASITPEVELNWSALEPSNGLMNFAPVDDLVAFSLQSNLRLHGHMLLWHKAVPDWAVEALREDHDWRLVERYFGSVLPRYRDVVRWWTVVNEPIDVGRADGLRQTVLLDAFGPDYVRRSLEQARAFAPEAKLFINEYGLEYDFPEEQQRRRALLRLVEGLKAKGAPLDGVGLQSHLDLNKGSISSRAVSRLVDELGKMGLAIAITELDVKEADYAAPPAERDLAVGDEVRRYLEVVLGSPNTVGVTTWGLSDRHSWLDITQADYARFPDAWRNGDGPGVNRGLPLDSSMNPKAMYEAIAETFVDAPTRRPFLARPSSKA